MHMGSFASSLLVTYKCSVYFSESTGACCINVTKSPDSVICPLRMTTGVAEDLTEHSSLVCFLREWYSVFQVSSAQTEAVGNAFSEPRTRGLNESSIGAHRT